MHLFSQSLCIVIPYGAQLMNATFSFSSARCIRRPDVALIKISYHCVIDVVLTAVPCLLYKVKSNSNRCLFSELPSASTRVRHIRVAAAAHPLEFKVSTYGTSQFARCLLPGQVRMRNDLPYTVFHTGTLIGCKGTVNRCMATSQSCVLFIFSWRRCLWGCESNLLIILLSPLRHVPLILIIKIIITSKAYYNFDRHSRHT